MDAAMRASSTRNNFHAFKQYKFLASLYKQKIYLQRRMNKIKLQRKNQK
jgi:hypothetical protein